MKKVHYAYLDDMKKYNENFNEKEYENREESEVVHEFKEYYKNMINEGSRIDLLTWCRVNEPSDDMIYKNGYWDQITFIRDDIMWLFCEDYKEYKDNPVMVLNTHMSKSIELPVYRISLGKYGIKITIRNNFHDWKLSMNSYRDIDCDFMNLFKYDNKISSVYCEGFKDNQVFDSYEEDKKQFTIELGDKYQVYSFMLILKNYLEKQ